VTPGCRRYGRRGGRAGGFLGLDCRRARREHRLEARLERLHPCREPPDLATLDKPEDQAHEHRNRPHWFHAVPSEQAWRRMPMVEAPQGRLQDQETGPPSKRDPSHICSGPI
jgi:hypothetical protein